LIFSLFYLWEVLAYEHTVDAVGT
jgi:hypothetical protein